jgi:antitoxin component YwqK of YwqJK toxin-antitoxin module
MKTIIVLLFLGIIIKPIFSQETYFFEQLSHDSIKIYFDKFGDLTSANKSAFYRIGKMDNYYFSFKGEVRDYTNENELLFTGNYNNGRLNGLAKLYKNGLLKEIGNYKNDLRDSIWIYYSNNRVEKKVDFSNNKFKLCESYTKKGISQIKDGICAYKDNVCAYKNTVKVLVKGKFKNGLLDGKWTYGAYTEYYKDGEFIKGVDNAFRTEYLDGPKLNLISFNPSEFTNFYYNFFIPLGRYDYQDTLFFPKFKGNGKLDSSFYKSLKDSIFQLFKYEQEGTYFLVELGISKASKIDYIRLYSPQNNDKSDRIKVIINNLGKWETARCGNKICASIIYFPIVVENRSVIIPQYTGYYRGELVNFVLNEFIK